MKKNYLVQRISYFIIGLSIAAFFFFILIYFLNFRNHSISSRIIDWALFGDYIGGVLNPILAIINICVFIILTITIQKITDLNNQQTIETNKKIALMSMKHEELKHFKETMDNNLKNWENNLASVKACETFLYGYNVLEYRLMFLFPELKDSENNRLLRENIVLALNNYRNGNIEGAKTKIIPVSNIYGMLVSDMGKWTVN